MPGLRSEIQRTRSQIQTTKQELEKMVPDYAVPLSKLIETNSRLEELAAYLRGLECQSRNNVIGRYAEEPSA